MARPDAGQRETGDRLLTAEDIAEHCQVSIRTVRRWIADGALQVVRLGRQVRIRPLHLERFIKQNLD